MTETATFAAGCFWGVEHKLARVPGVTRTAVGYMGGGLKNPTYEDVCTDETGHAEVAQVEFDPGKVGFEVLVRKFYDLHDPTQLNRQGPDEGSQYRTAIFYHSPQQKEIAERVTAELNQSRYKGRIVTQIVPAKEFWRAEEYHQKYGEKHPGHHCTL
jgi:peptide-methionine (S)-S-oxide reductase